MVTPTCSDGSLATVLSDHRSGQVRGPVRGRGRNARATRGGVAKALALACRKARCFCTAAVAALAVSVSVATAIAAPAARADVEGYVLSVEGKDVIVDVGAASGASVGDVFELWRPIE